MKKTIIFLLAVLMLGMASCADPQNDPSEDSPSEVIDGIDRTCYTLQGEIIKVESDTEFTVRITDFGKDYIGKEARIVIEEPFKDDECFEIDKPEIGKNVEVGCKQQHFHDEDGTVTILFDNISQTVNSDGSSGEYNTYIRYI